MLFKVITPKNSDYIYSVKNIMVAPNSVKNDFSLGYLEGTKAEAILLSKGSFIPGVSVEVAVCGILVYETTEIAYVPLVVPKNEAVEVGLDSVLDYVSQHGKVLDVMLGKAGIDVANKLLGVS